jgi:hypothetical protein
VDEERRKTTEASAVSACGNRVQNFKLSKVKKMSRLRSIQTLVCGLATHARAEEESERPQIPLLLDV